MENENINEALEMDEIDESELDEVTGGAGEVRLTHATEEIRYVNVKKNIKRKRCPKDSSMCLTGGFAAAQKSGLTVGGMGQCPKCKMWYAFKVNTVSGGLASKAYGPASNAGALGKYF